MFEPKLKQKREESVQHLILKPLSQGRKSRFKFGVYDIETQGKDFLDFHSAGFFDGERYWYFRDMADFMCHCIQPEYHNYRFFAHFGGRFDVHFVFDWLRANHPETEMEINCSGSAVISLTVKSGKYRWRFVDSFRLMPKSLLSLTIDFDVKHKKLTGLQFTDRKYNEHDCRGLYEVLEIFFDEFDITSETIASHGMRVFRSHFMKREIWQPHREIEDFVRSGYVGGRCEIYRYDKAELHHYDVNSLFPCAMLRPVPVEYLFRTKKLVNSDTRIGFYRAKIEYPERYIPILHFHADKLYFPFGKFEGTYTGMELERAIEHGAKVKIIEGYLFLADPIMRGYAEGLFEMKQVADIEGKSAKRYIAKILLNSLYGKWGQRREQKAFIVDDGRMGAFPLPNGLAYYMIESRAAHINPHISATITARARLIQHDLLEKGKQWYTDTDSLFTDTLYPTSDNLGDLHYEGRGEFQAFRLKEYKFKSQYKIKGLPRCRDIEKTESERAAYDLELAEKYLAGEKITSERMRGMAESIRKGLPAVGKVRMPRARNEIRDKRCRIKNDTRPWNASELI